MATPQDKEAAETAIVKLVGEIDVARELGDVARVAHLEDRIRRLKKITGPRRIIGGAGTAPGVKPYKED